MPLDFDVEEELRTNKMKVIDEGSLWSSRGLLPYILTILERLGAPGIITERELKSFYLENAARVWRSNGVMMVCDGEVSLPAGHTIQYPPGFPTPAFLRALPDDYFGKQVEFPRSEGFSVPFSLERDGDKLYVRVHMTEEECRMKVEERK